MLDGFLWKGVENLDFILKEFFFGKRRGLDSDMNYGKHITRLGSIHFIYTWVCGYRYIYH